MVTDAKRDASSMGLAEAVIEVIAILQWQDARDLRNASAKRPRRKKATK